MANNIDVHFFKPFVDGTVHMIDVQCSTKATYAQPYLKNKTPSPLVLDIAGTVGIWTKDYRGNICLAFPKATFLNIMNKMLGEEYTEINDENKDGAGEMMNIVFGFAKRILNEQGHSFEKALPSIIIGQNLIVSHHGQVPVFVLPFTSEFGDFHLEIGLMTVE